MADTPRRRGRPVKDLGDRPRGPLSVRLRDEVRSDLQVSAARHGRSLSEEIEARLEASLAVQTYLKSDWGADVFTIARSLAASISQIENTYKCSWFDEDKVVEITRLTASQLVENYKVWVRNDLSGWEALGTKGRGDPLAAEAQEAAEIFAARDLLALPRVRGGSVADEAQKK